MVETRGMTEDDIDGLGKCEMKRIGLVSCNSGMG